MKYCIYSYYIYFKQLYQFWVIRMKLECWTCKLILEVFHFYKWVNVKWFFFSKWVYSIIILIALFYVIKPMITLFHIFSKTKLKQNKVSHSHMTHLTDSSNCTTSDRSKHIGVFPVNPMFYHNIYKICHVKLSSIYQTVTIDTMCMCFTSM